LQAARELGLRRRIVLPFAAPRFRATSVARRGEAWGAVFDELVGEAEGGADLVVLSGAPDSDAAYRAANERILDDAVVLAGAQGRAVAVVVWEGRPRGTGDLTSHFRQRAEGVEPLALDLGGNDLELHPR
jgi:hypothetical protein